MTPPIPDPIDEAESPDGWERTLLDRQLERLDRLAEAGLELALALKDQATPDRLAEAGAPAEIAMAFSRVSRAVRMTLALQSRLVRDFKTPRPSPPAEAEEPDWPLEVVWLTPSEADQKAGRKYEVRSAVRRRAEDAALDSETVERLVTEADERLEQDDIHRDILTRPLEDLVALICKDLGLEPPAEAETTSGLPGSPFTRPPPGTAVRGGGGPLAERSEERVVEGAGHIHPPFNGSS